MTEDVFKLPQSSYEELSKVIKAYGHFKHEVGLEEVSRLTSLHTTIISRNVGFLLAVGILSPGSKKIITETGKSLSQALEHEMPDEIRESWRTIVHESDFLSKVIAAIKIRNGMDQQTLESHIAYSAGQPKKPQFMTGARTVIEILRAAELVRDADGKFVADSYASELSERVIRTSSAPQEWTSPSVSISVSEPHRPTVSVGSGLRVVININLSCTANDIEALGPKLRELVSALSDEASGKTGS